MNKINICENFKNENLPLIFNINYEGFSKYNKNETYMQIYNKFFNSISENESLYEIIKCIVTAVSLNEESNLNSHKKYKQSYTKWENIVKEE